MKRRTRYVIALAVAWGMSAPADAINIVPVFNNVDNETPAFDIFNQGIQDLFNYAEGYFEDMIEDPGYTVTLNFWYEDLQDNFLGLYNTVSTSGGLVTEGNIRIDTREGNGGVFRDWYIDSTPANDSEFEMGKILFDDLSGVQTLDYVNAIGAPDALEVGYRGSAVNGGQAHLKFDMLSTLLHEVGHALGIRSGATENDDDDYDINPNFVFGSTVAAEIDTKDGQPDPGHMKPGTLLMCGECGSANVRRRPSHFDIFAMATSLGFTQVDVPRREFLGGGVWGVNGNWSGNRTPDANDEAFMRQAGLVVMNAGDTVAGLTLIDSTTLAIGSNMLNVNGTLTLDSRFSNSQASLVVGSGGQLIANDVMLNRNGELDMAGGNVSVLGDLDMNERELVGDDEGAITGNGTVTIIGQLRGIGQFRPDGGTLTINAGSFDLDGDSDEFGFSLIDATQGNIVFNGQHTDSYGTNGDDIVIGFGRLVTFNNAWTLEELGDVTITDGGLINNATWHTDGQVVIDHTVPFGIVGIGGTGDMIQGAVGEIATTGIVDFLGHATIGGAINVNSEAARFSAGGTFTDTAVVTLAPGTTMNLIFANTYTLENNATFTGPGTLVIGELATVVLESGISLGAPLINNGRMEIGDSPGQATINADFGQGFTGVAEFEIGGLSGRNFDSLDVSGFNAVLDGTLELSLIDGFVPDIGDTFTIIQAGSIVGTFDTITDLSGGLIFDVVYNPTSVVVHVTKLLGDLNGDGFVGIDDLNIVLTNWNQNVPPGDPLADPNGDGFVGIDDLNTVLGNWNAGVPPTSTANIPEPGTAGLMGVFGLVLNRWGRWGRR